MPLNPPRKSAIVALVIGAVLFAAVITAKTAYPPLRAVTNPRLEGLRAEQASLMQYSDQRVTDQEMKLAQLKRELWTPDTFAIWKRDLLPGWVLKDLGPTETQRVRGRRYALEFPGAGAKEWEQIIGQLRSLEILRCTSVQSVNLSVQAGLTQSRKFSTCQFIIVFFFANETPATTETGTPGSSAIATKAKNPAAASAASPANSLRDASAKSQPF